MDAKIEKGIPVPARRKWLDVVKQMQVGDSIVVNQSGYTRIKAAGRTIGISMVSSTKGEAAGLYRVWRTA